MIASVAWLAVTSISIYSGAIFAWMGVKAQIILGSGAVGISALAAKLGSAASTKDSGANPFAGFVIRIGPALFVLALAIGTSAFVRNIVLGEGEANVKSLRARVTAQRRDIDEIDPWNISEERVFVNGKSTSDLTLTRDFTLYPEILSNGVREIRSAIQATPTANFLWAIGVPLVIAVLLSARFDINMNSLNSAWSNRILRCYLGASNQKRSAHSSTGFDETDDLPLIALTDAARLPATDSPKAPSTFADIIRNMCRGLVYGLPLNQTGRMQSASNDYDGPLHLINGALNVYGSDDLSRQERRAESFVLSPLYCGYSLANPLPRNTEDDEEKRPPENYTATDQYAGQISLGSAVGISGAAASPNMGYHTMPSLAALMTIFNVRLGWWLPNPAKKDVGTLRSRGPRVGLKYLATELFSRTTADTKYVYVTDGGHFENLATYELIRRRTKFIVIVDGESDSTYEFHGLGSLVRKCRIDFGVEIQISAHSIQPAGADKIRNPSSSPATLEDRLSSVNYALGLIRYPTTGAYKESQGLLIYVKSSLVAEDALHVADLRQYAETHSSFPHESTADQFFSESQFESYRLLGQLVMSRVLSEIMSKKSDGVVQESGVVNSMAVAELMEDVEPLRTYCLRQDSVGGIDSSPVDRTSSAASASTTVDNRGPKAEESVASEFVSQQQKSLAKLLSEFRSHCQGFSRPKSVE